MKISDVMARIVAQCPGFVSVDHALSSNEELDYPAALVAPVMVRAQPPRLLGVHSQIERVTLGVFIVLERRRNASADQLDTLRGQLRAALIGWQPHPDYLPLEAAGGQLDQYRPGIAGWREDFSTETEILA